MRTAPLLLYASLASMTVAIIAELVGLLPAIAPTAPEGLRVLGGTSVALGAFLFGWTFADGYTVDPDQEGDP